MVKNGTKKLCYRESLEDCSNCFPERSPQDFWLRKHYIQKHFEYADAFVSPSEFLRQRYIAWGIPEEHIVVIENGQPSPSAKAAAVDGCAAESPFRLLWSDHRIQRCGDPAPSASPHDA